MKKILIFAAAAILFVSCGTASKGPTRGELYPGMYKARPVTLLVMPPMNKTSNVEAKELLYTSISRPLAEAGYYVISPLLAMQVLKSESAYDSELFVEEPLTKFKDFFGADAVVFSEILTWAKQGFTVRTKIRYFIKSAYTNEILFDRTCDLTLDTRTNFFNNRSVLGAALNLASSALNTALTEHIQAARGANYYIFRDIPRGKYSDSYDKDSETAASPAEITANSR